LPRWTSRVRVPFPAPPSSRPQLDPAASPSGKATVCKTVIPSSSLGAASILSFAARGAAPAAPGGAAGARTASHAPHPAGPGSRSAETRCDTDARRRIAVRARRPIPGREEPGCGPNSSASAGKIQCRTVTGALRVHSSVARSTRRETRVPRPATGTVASAEWKFQLVDFHALRMFCAPHTPVPARVHANVRTPLRSAFQRRGTRSGARIRGSGACFLRLTVNASARGAVAVRRRARGECGEASAQRGTRIRRDGHEKSRETCCFLLTRFFQGFYPAKLTGSVASLHVVLVRIGCSPQGG
jgi:hypothetical protein